MCQGQDEGLEAASVFSCGFLPGPRQSWTFEYFWEPAEQFPCQMPKNMFAGQGQEEEEGLAWRLLLTSHVTLLFLSKTLANWQNCVCRSRAGGGGGLGLEAASDLSCGFLPSPRQPWIRLSRSRRGGKSSHFNIGTM